MRRPWLLHLAVCFAACSAPGRLASLEVSGFVQAGEGYHYEAWLETADGPASLVKFEGTQDVLEFEIDEDVLELVDHRSRFMVTLQPDGLSTPSEHVVLWDGVSSHTYGHEFYVESGPFPEWYDVVCCKPSYQIATPTTGDDGDEGFGLWWLGFDIEPYASLGQQWVFEGWVVTPQGRFSTGRFRGQAPDDDGPGPSAGPLPGFDAPGQDFIDPPLSILGAHIEITIEPEPDDSPEPFVFAPWGTEVSPTADTGPNSSRSFPYDFDARQPRAELWVPYEAEEP